MKKEKIVINISKRDLDVIGIGHVKAGETLTVPNGFHNANFEVVGENKNIKNNKTK